MLEQKKVVEYLRDFTTFFMEITKQFFLPEEYRENFYVEDFLEIKDGYKLIIYEKKELIPEDLQGKEVVFNGFCNSLTLVDDLN